MSSNKKFTKGLSSEGEVGRSLKRTAEDSSEDEGESEALKKKKLTISMKSPSAAAKDKGLTTASKITAPVKSSKKPEPKLIKASVFGDSDSEDEVEEMPPEARMRMKNIGRDTPTSAGPNSFGKTRQGFCDSKKVFERQLKKAMDGSD